MDLTALHAAITGRWPRHLETIRDFVRQPSIGASGEGTVECAGMVRDAIARLGGTAELVPIGRWPIVYGRLDVGAEKTVLVWSKYDVMPVDEPGWVVPPFGAEIREWHDLGDCLLGRGAVDTKGSLQGFLNAVATLVELDALPVNLIFVIEGEGEAGSGGMAEFVDTHRAELEAADVALVPFFTQEPDGSAAPNLGVKGLVTIELRSVGGEWGGPAGFDVHGGHAAWLANPAWRLVKALATMVGPHDEVLIDGYADGAIGPDPDDERLLAELDGMFDLDDQLKICGARRFKYDGPASVLAHHEQFDPTCNISGIRSGYTGEGFKTLVPHEAIARMDLRLVPGMRPETVLGAMRRHLDERGFTDIEIVPGEQYPASKVPLSDPYAQAMVRMYGEHGVPTTVMPMKSGCAPLYLFSEVLGVPWVMAGLGHGGGQHTSNEYVTVQGLLDFEKSIVTLLVGFARVG